MHTTLRVVLCVCRLYTCQPRQAVTGLATCVQVQIDKTAILSEADVSGAARRLNTEEYKLPQDIGEVLR